MSYWTYLSGSITVQAPRFVYDKKTLSEYTHWAIEQITEKANITGSEQNVMIMPEVLPNSGWIGDGPYSRDEYCNVFLGMNGWFRDREFDRTYKETHEFLNELKKYFQIEKITVSVWNDYGDKQKILTSVKADTTRDEIEYINTDGCDLDDEAGMAIEMEETRVRWKNWERFKHVFCTKERMVQAIELLNMMPPSVFEDVLNSHPMDRMIDWDFSDSLCEYLYREGLEMPKLSDKYLEDLKKHIAEEDEKEKAEREATLGKETDNG